jgi:predicted DNA-binding protein (MmcQ/YjbR family)
MNFDDAMDACAAHPATVLEYPFGEDVHVFKVVGKVFAILGSEGGPARITLKADPEDARALVATFPEVTPGYHMNKKHWVSVSLPTTAAPLSEMIRDSYDLVVATLPRAKRPVGPSA